MRCEQTDYLKRQNTIGRALTKLELFQIKMERQIYVLRRDDIVTKTLLNSNKIYFLSVKFLTMK